MSTLIAAEFTKKLKSHQSDTELKKYHRYFDFKEGGKKDSFIGVRMGTVFALAKEFIDMPSKEIEKLLESPIHEIRAGACSIMGKSASAKKTPESRRKELYDLYLKRHDRINNWDLVDLASYKVVGSYLYDFKKPRAVLYKLAKSKDTWERRTAIVSTLYFVGEGDLNDAFKIAELLVNEKQDLVNKGTGWVLRAAGAKDRPRLLKFLDKHAAKMARITLRYAIEHLPNKQRDHYLGLKAG
jgi:3-methyladenine DNA glycosylase AlkD